MSNAIRSSLLRCIDKSVVFKNSVMLCLALIFNLDIQPEQSENDKIGSRLLVNARYGEPYTIIFGKPISICGSVIKARSSKSGDTGSIPAGC